MQMEPYGQKRIVERIVDTDYAFRTFPLERLQASVFDRDPASARVLEKVGCVLEWRLQQPFHGRTPSGLAALRASSPLIGN